MKKGMTNKIFILSIFSLFLLSFLSVNVLAENGGEDIAEKPAEGIRGISTGVAKVFGEILAPLFGDQELLSRVFFAILIGMIVYSVVPVLFKGRWIKLSITIAITGLALIGLPGGFLEAIRVSYGAMGAAILAFIPFLVVFIFSVKVDNSLTARMVWLIFAFYYAALFAYKILTDYGTFITKAGWLSGETIPYIVAIIVGFGIFIGIGTIRDLVWKGELEAFKEAGVKDIAYRRLGRELERKETKERTEVSP